MDGILGPVTDPFAVWFDFPKEPDHSYRIEMLPGAIRSREGWTHDTLSWSFRTHPEDHFGTVKFALNVQDDLKQGVLEVYKENGLVVFSEMIYSDTLISMGNMLPASYNARFIVDSNQNGRWDPISYDRKEEPEKVFNLGEAIVVRSNWELDLEWDIFEDQ